MSDEPFGRQPKPVYVEFKGEQADIDYYRQCIKRAIEIGTYDNVEVYGLSSLTIYPRAVNE